ncbi:MAG: hypothetical protein GTN78_12005 [Gemmatimonadales bacterium]|nr:hypothetical protein [Gemmatimonadales bacterium]
MPQAQYTRSGKLWYVGDGLIWDSRSANYQRPDMPLECSSKLFVFNPQRHAAGVTARFFHIDRPPTQVELSVRPGEVECLELAALSEIPHGQAFWIVVEADMPVLPQACHEDFFQWDPVPDALISPTPYPGPLEDETTWMAADCFNLMPRKGWYEFETLTILNPGKQSVQVRLTYSPMGGGVGEESVDIPAERVTQINTWQRFPVLQGAQGGPQVAVLRDHAIRVDATSPVIAQSTRRAHWTGIYGVIGARSSIVAPLRHPGCTTWHYPGGSVDDSHVKPRREGLDVKWDLLFINNPDEARPASCTLAFHHPDGSVTASEPMSVGPHVSGYAWLHRPPCLGTHTHIDEPFGLTVKSDVPVIPEMCHAEFDNLQAPGAMGSVYLYPGPLTDETTWWLGVGRRGGSDDDHTEWKQAYHLFNPGPKPVRAALSVLGIGAPVTHAVDIGAGAVVRVNASDISGIPMNVPFVVRADADGPFCAQAYGRTFSRGLPSTRGMYGLMGVPMKLED